MNRYRLFRNIAVSVVLLLAISLLSGVIVLRTQWFRSYMQQTIAASLQESTGGRAEIGSFEFDEGHLHATVRDLVIHGTEATNEAPFVSIAAVDAEFRLLPGLRHLYEISSLRIDRPKVNIHDNLPIPRKKSQSSSSALDTVLNLAVRHFAVKRGSFSFFSASQPLEIQGDNLRIKLEFNPAQQGYVGDFALEPLYVINGVATPVRIRIDLPVTIARDRLALNHGVLETPRSRILLNVSLESRTNPRLNAHLQARVAGADLSDGANLPKPLPDLSVDADAAGKPEAIAVASLHAAFGHSTIEASGGLKEVNGIGPLQVRARLSLSELARIARISAKPDGVAEVNATLKLAEANRYEADGNIEIPRLSLEAGARRVSNVAFHSGFHADPQNLSLSGARLNALGGEVQGDAVLRNFQRFEFQGRLRELSIRNALIAAGEPPSYDGAIEGTLEAQGDISHQRDVQARGHLTIRPGLKGVPVSGRLNATYQSEADDVRISDSFIALPHSRLDLSGSLTQRLNIAFTSKDLRDVTAAGSATVTLAGSGKVDFHGTVTGGLSNPQITGELAASRFSIQGRPFDSLAAALTASSSRAVLSRAVLVRNTMRATAEGALTLNHWAPKQTSAVSLNTNLENGDLGDLMVLAGLPGDGYSGAVAASARVNGTWGHPLGAATLSASDGTIAGEPFHNAQLQADLTDQEVTLKTAYLESPAGRLDVTAAFRHPRDRFLSGTIHAQVRSSTLDFSRLFAGKGSPPGLSGIATIRADFRADVQDSAPQFLLSSVDADISARSMELRGVNYGDWNASARTTGSSANYSVTSSFAGSNIRITGQTELKKDYPSSADLEVAGLPIERALSAAGQAGFPATGILSASLHLNGPIAAPQGDIRLELTKASLYEEPIDRVQLRADYSAQEINLARLDLTTGGARLEASGRYHHSPGKFGDGRAEFKITNGRIDLAHIAHIQKYRPGLSGVADLSADGEAEIIAAVPRVLLTAFNANVSTTGIAAQGKQLGNLKLTATSQPGQRLAFALDSNLAGSTIRGSGSANLSGRYPLDAQLTFRDVSWSRISELIGRRVSGQTGNPAFDAATDGELRLQGPLMNSNQFSGALTLTKLAMTTMPPTAARKSVTIANQGPLQVTLSNGTVQLQNVHLTGPQTNIQASGSGGLNGERLNFDLRVDSDIGLLRDLDTSIYSSGQISLAAAIRGSSSKPLVDGRLQLHDAGFSTPQMPVGISNANGAVLFNRDTARIQTLTAESGGGKVTATGTASFSDTPRFALKTDARNVRIRMQQGMSLTTNATINIASTPAGSQVTGTATLTRLTYAPQSDFGSILARSAPTVEAPTDTSPFLSNMKLDLRVRNSPGMTVESSISQDLQADVDLRVRGSGAEPVAQGRIEVSEGKLAFFGTTYNVNRGTVSFFNPLRIEPVLDISLSAQAQGVNVTLQVTGTPENMKLSYTSDPPLQFEEIVALLGSGRTPTSDPTLLASPSASPQQGLQQAGEAAILGQVVANPVASQMQRVFGVTQLKIDPSFTTGSNVPTARLALQQRITNNLTFTYVSAIDQPNSTVIRMEWAFNPQWSAVATRDQNGIFSVNFFYKREFR